MYFTEVYKPPGSLEVSFNACADGVYQALFSAYEKEPGVKANALVL